MQEKKETYYDSSPVKSEIESWVKSAAKQN